MNKAVLKRFLFTAAFAFPAIVFAADADNDGLQDNVETNTGVYVSTSNTGTNPNNPDSDGDGAGDWYEVAIIDKNPALGGLPNSPNNASLKPNIPYPLPDPDASTGATNKPVKVYIMSGQSNMVGIGYIAGGAGSLNTIAKTEKKFPNLVTAANGWTTRNDVRYRGVITAIDNGLLTPGVGGAADTQLGPELGFGHVMGYHHDEPVLLLKTSQGNRSLMWDILPPGRPSINYNGSTYAGYGQSPLSRPIGSSPSPGGWYAGKQYDDFFLHESHMGPVQTWTSGIAFPDGCQLRHNGVLYISKSAHTSAATSQPGVGATWTTFWDVYAVTNVVNILDNFATQYPQWAAQGFEIAGFVWWQGHKDQGEPAATHYEANLVSLINSLRTYYGNRYPGKIAPKAPFVLGTIGFNGWALSGAGLKVANAQLAVSDPVKYPGFAGNVKTMESRSFWRTLAQSPGTQDFHYHNNAETYMLMGDALGRAMIDLLNAAAPAPFVWTQTAGNAQAWASGANWAGGSVPVPAAGDIMDFSTVDILANTTLTLGADRTAQHWKFGDTAGAETWTVSAGNTITLAGAAPTIEVVTSTSALNCVLAGSAGLTKSGAGNLILAAANTYTGGTILTNGTLTLNHASALGAGTLTLGGANNPYLNNTSGSPLTPTNPMIWAGNFRLGGNFNFATSNVSLTASGTQEIYSTLTVGGVISGTVGINKQGTGNLVLNGLNTYTGSTVARQGTVTINTLKNYGVASSLGAPTTGSIVIAPNNSTTLSYTGTGDTTNRPIQVGGIGSAGVTASVSNNGTGALVFTAAIFNTPAGITGGSAARSLALTGGFGTTATPNEVQGVIGDNTLNGATAPANRVSLVKGGAGAWKISGANTYTGTTNISAGTLILGLSHVLPDTTNVSLGAAILDADTRTDTAGTLDVTGAATIRFGTGGTLRFADSSAIDWTGGTLTVTGTFVSGSSLRFGASASALTPAQLALISKPGGGPVALNASGFLIDAAAGNYAAWAATNAPGTTPDQDQDGDGVSNGVEYVLGGTALTNDLSRLPVVSKAGGNLIYTFQRTQASINASTTLAIRVGTTLLTWPDSYTVGADTAASSAGVTILKGVPSGFDTVTFSVPQSPDSEKFVRLSVTITP
jgi:autotransporter-associated beta strand protein